MNGRIGSDQNTGSFTCYTHNGESVVDYLITMQENFDIISSFYVEDFTIHSKIMHQSLSVLEPNILNMRPIHIRIRHTDGMRHLEIIFSTILTKILTPCLMISKITLTIIAIQIHWLPFLPNISQVEETGTSKKRIM